MTITATDLPGETGTAVLELADGATLNLSRTGTDLFYGHSESFDVEENSAMMIAKLNKWGARIIGWE